MAVSKSTLRWLAVAVLIVAALLFIQNRRRSAIAVRTATVERGDIHSSVVTNGISQPVRYRELRAETEGEVVRVLVEEGTTVLDGQPIAELNQRQVRSDLDAARSALAEAENSLRILRQGGADRDVQELRSQWDAAQRTRDTASADAARNERLYEKGAVARLELEQSRTRLAQAEADFAVLDKKLTQPFGPEELSRAEARVRASQSALALAESRLASATVAAPFAGLLYSVAIRPGDYVRAGDVLARVGELDRMNIRAYVDEPDLGRVAAGQPVLVRWDGLPDREWKGTVERLPSEIKDLDSRRVGEVLCTLENPQRELLPNMNLNVEIVTENKSNALTVPREAVSGSGNDRHVFIIRDGVLHRLSVKAGLFAPTRVEILEGLKEGDTVALPGEQPFEDSLRVRPSSP